MEFHGRSSANLLGHFDRETGLPPIKTTHCDDKVEKPLANPYYYLPFGAKTYDYQSTQRIDYIHDEAGIRFPAPWSKAYEHQNQETDYIRRKMKSAAVVLPRHERKDGQANEHTQTGMRSFVPYDVEKQEYTYQQETEYIREKTELPFVRSLYIHDYENGRNEHIQAEMKLRGLYNVRKKHEYTYQYGTEYLQEKTNSHYARALPIHEYEKGQGTEHAQVEMKPAGRPFYVPEKHEYTNEQGIEYIREKTNTPCGRVFPIHEYEYVQGNKHTRAVMRLRGPDNVSEKHEYTNQQGTEYIREKTHTPMVQWLPSHEYKIGRGKEHTRAGMRSSGPYNVPEKYEYTTEQGIEAIREKTHTPHVRMLPKHEYGNEQGIEHIQTTMKSPAWTRKQNELFEFRKIFML